MRYRTSNYATAEYPPEWDEPDDDFAIDDCTKKYLDANRIGMETKQEFTGFYISNNMDKLISMNVRTVCELIDDCWQSHCHDCAIEAVKPGGEYWEDRRREYEAEEYCDGF